MKYLGVPLLAKRLGVSDCKCLIDNVENRITCWKNRHLSYAGRIQLIASVLSAMQQYWASVFMLPDTVIKELDQLFKRFLWNAGNSAKGKARVAWHLVCRPKEQGGLGIKPIKKWNEVLIINQLKKLIEKKDSLWVKLEMENLFQLGMINGFHKAIFDARMSDKECLADIIHEGKWMWPPEWNVTFPQVRSIKIPMLNDRLDGVKWLDKNNQVCKFSTKNVWLTLRDDWPKVDWKHIVWFSQCNPKQAVILLMAIPGKLLTQDRMIWVENGDLKCSLCKSWPDSHDHLFFNCPYASNIWHMISSKGNMLSGMQSLNNEVRLGNLLEGVCSSADDAWGWSLIMLFSEDVAARLALSQISTQEM
ncbi:RNA-directed DNA polymerase, eukaryota, reverse transcriptase zinc-binding domain protein [Tanacetum coccineum]